MIILDGIDKDVNWLPGSGDDVSGGENIGGGAGPIGASKSYTCCDSNIPSDTPGFKFKYSE